jgi:hypothetical protein
MTTLAVFISLSLWVSTVSALPALVLIEIRSSLVRGCPTLLSLAEVLCDWRLLLAEEF